MKKNRQHQPVTSRELSTLEKFVNYAASIPQAASELPITDDDRYPGSFFRIPGLPTPGKTTWSLAK